MNGLLARLLTRYMSEEDEGMGSAASGDTSTGIDSASEPTGEDVNWGGIADEFVEADNAVEGEDVVVEEEAPATEPAQVAPASTEPAPAAPPTAPPASTEPVTPAPVAPTASNEEYGAWRETRLSQLEQVYALDQEAANAMLTEPETVLPKLAAKIHMEVLENSMRAMQAMVPVMMQSIQHHTEINSRAKNLFTSVNPDLADPRYEGAIMELGAVYRNVNRTAPPEEAARAIGNLVRAALGIAAPQAGQGAQAPTQQVMQAAVAPFAPVRGAGGGQMRSAPSNPFEALAAEMENEEW